MFSNVNGYEINMPRKYVELSDDEMEYDGGFGWAIIGAICSVVSVAITVAMPIIPDDYKKIATAVSVGLGVAGAVLTFGATSSALAANTAVTTQQAAAYVVTNVHANAASVVVAGASAKYWT
ncbi:MAG: hypothetical protein LBJ20_00620 [Candidatus Methanoplasma sp.]|jgi:hypothetical protein|nr:hypothetical protein [Candidatus Methanoplasma sp.]